MLSTSAQQLIEVGSSMGLEGADLLNFIREQQKLEREEKDKERERQSEERALEEERKEKEDQRKKEETAFMREEAERKDKLLQAQASLCCYDKATTNPEVFKRKFLVLRSELSCHVEIYTDRSKDGIRTAATVVAPNSVKTVRLPDNASIFTAEIHALDMALDMIRRTRSKDYVVFSDSLSSLQAIESCKIEYPPILKIMKDHNQLTNSGKSITFCWIPSHVGIRGNEDADIAAKAGLDVATTNMRFPVSDLLTCANQLCVREWQKLWNQCTSSKLYSVQPAICRSVSSSLGRYDSVLINRL